MKTCVMICLVLKQWQVWSHPGNEGRWWSLSLIQILLKSLLNQNLMTSSVPKHPFFNRPVLNYHAQHYSVAALFAKYFAIEMILLDLSFKMNLWWIYYVVTFLQLICMLGGWGWKALICGELHPSLKHYKALGHQQRTRLIHGASLEDAGLCVSYKAWLMTDWLHCMWNRLV